MAERTHQTADLGRGNKRSSGFSPPNFLEGEAGPTSVVVSDHHLSARGKATQRDCGWNAME
jgi:hypothetical protein